MDFDFVINLSYLLTRTLSIAGRTLDSDATALKCCMCSQAGPEQDGPDRSGNNSAFDGCVYALSIRDRLVNSAIRNASWCDSRRDSINTIGLVLIA